MLDPRYLRQQDAVDMDRLSNLSISLIGAGAIGSTTAVWLGKMGVRDIRIFDDDVVEEHNWSNQLYRETDIGSAKAESLYHVMKVFGINNQIAILERYEDQPLSEIVIGAVDSMSSRKIIWKAARAQDQVKLLIDARMGLETLIIHSVDPRQREDRLRYSKTLHTDGEALQEPCTARTICYTPLMASSVVCNMVKRYANGETVPGQVVLDLATYTLMT